MLVNGGVACIGIAVVRCLLVDTIARVFNLYELLEASGRYQLLQVDLVEAKATVTDVCQVVPDLVMHVAVKSHVGRTIDGLWGLTERSVTSTFNLLQSVRCHFE